MPDENEPAGDWSRPDSGIDPEEYVEDGPQEGPGGDKESAPAEASSKEPSAEADGAADPMAPGSSVADESDVDAVEPNEPA